jgi:hypothetical protein
MPGNNGYCSPMPPVEFKQLRMGCAYDKAWSGPREETTPCPKPTSTSEQTPPHPRLASANCTPQIPQKATPSTVPYATESPRAGSAMASGRHPPLPSVDKRTLDATKSYRADVGYSTYCQAFFAILTTAPTTTTQTTPPSS